MRWRTTMAVSASRLRLNQTIRAHELCKNWTIHSHHMFQMRHEVICYRVSWGIIKLQTVLIKVEIYFGPPLHQTPLHFDLYSSDQWVISRLHPDTSLWILHCALKPIQWEQKILTFLARKNQSAATHWEKHLARTSKVLLLVSLVLSINRNKMTKHVELWASTICLSLTNHLSLHSEWFSLSVWPGYGRVCTEQSLQTLTPHTDSHRI